jgi:hypothetical protein
MTVGLTSKNHFKVKEHLLIIFETKISRSGSDVCRIWQQTLDHGLHRIMTKHIIQRMCASVDA